MEFKDKATVFFWMFLFLAILLQLFANQEISFITAFSYSTCVILTLHIYLSYISGKWAQHFLANLNTLAFLGVMGISCLVATFALSVEGYLILTLTAPESTLKEVTDDRVAVIFGLFTFSAMVSGLNYSFEKYKQYLEREKELEVLQRKSLEMEIKLLRNQLSPHFTFNILNNLQFLIRKDQNEALLLLSQYSKILRYYVYESQKKLIPLDQEITFLKEYFDLEKNRHAEELQISCEWHIPENELYIVPFVLATFVENAFKHVLPNQENDYFIKEYCTVDLQGNLTFEITNTFDENVAKTKSRGIGLKHAEERLTLAYPDRYQLMINEDNELFSVRLKLTLEKQIGKEEL
ncbi:histidine kinase [Cytophagaceae bacterium YF14B1]|uniref:Histidine kinase n=1 Tax=Xanthocytophaga flava TaxID=3048013 RepID=A0AAE3U7M0_9BACT|nr:histidine kinase [Xanthocytophaga flavus]MDJ1481757.1 histidine kinase [Xanthocytophaga flavus]